MAIKRKASSGSETKAANRVRQMEPKSTQVGPEKEDLLELFSAGKIPLAGDFAELIDVADAGRRAAGRSPDQGTLVATGAGLGLDEIDRLHVRPAVPNSGLNVTNGVQVGEGAGITVAGATVAVKPDTSKGMAVGPDGVRVSISEETLQYSGSSIRVKYADNTDNNYFHYGLAVKSTGPNAAYKVLGVKHDDTLLVNTPEVSSSGALGVKQASEGGLTYIATEGKNGLGVKLQNNPGLKLGPTGLAVHAGVGLSTDANGLKVGQGNGITVSGTTVSVKIKDNNSGLVLDATGLSVAAGTGIPVAGNGIAISGNTVSVKINNGGVHPSGLEADGNGLRAKVALEGGHTGREGLHVKPNGVLGVYVESEVLEIKSNGSLGLHPHQAFKRGMIMAFYGGINDIPGGWVICNGQNSTPDLTNKFVLGGTWNDVGGSGGTALAGDKNSKYFQVTTDPSTKEEGTDDPGTKKMFADDGHTHTVKITPPYYILAYIMKT